jgi:methenyltetrahydromethanopterin cyclohydrolase
MTELFTMIVLAANIIVASAFARFAPTATTDVAAVGEQTSDADTYEGRMVARIRARDVRSADARDIGASTSAYWGSPLF